MEKDLSKIFYCDSKLVKLLNGNDSNTVKYVGLSNEIDKDSGNYIYLDVYKMICLIPTIEKYKYNLNNKELEYIDKEILNPERSLDNYRGSYKYIIYN